MIIRNTEKKDIDCVLEIYKSAIASLKKAGIDQWQNGYPDISDVELDIKNKVSRVCLDENGNILAVAAAYVGNEPTYDKILKGAWLTNLNNYGIVHRIAVLPQSKGHGVSGKIFDYAAQLVLKAGLLSLRCDTHMDNIPMQNALTNFGFVYCGIIFVEDGASRLAYEKLL